MAICHGGHGQIWEFVDKNFYQAIYRSRNLGYPH